MIRPILNANFANQLIRRYTGFSSSIDAPASMLFLQPWEPEESQAGTRYQSNIHQITTINNIIENNQILNLHIGLSFLSRLMSQAVREIASTHSRSDRMLERTMLLRREGKGVVVDGPGTRMLTTQAEHATPQAPVIAEQFKDGHAATTARAAMIPSGVEPMTNLILSDLDIVRVALNRPQDNIWNPIHFTSQTLIHREESQPDDHEAYRQQASPSHGEDARAEESRRSSAHSQGSVDETATPQSSQGNAQPERETAATVSLQPSARETATQQSQPSASPSLPGSNPTAEAPQGAFRQPEPMRYNINTSFPGNRESSDTAVSPSRGSLAEAAPIFLERAIGIPAQALVHLRQAGLLLGEQSAANAGQSGTWVRTSVRQNVTEHRSVLIQPRSLTAHENPESFVQSGFPQGAERQQPHRESPSSSRERAEAAGSWQNHLPTASMITLKEHHDALPEALYKTLTEQLTRERMLSQSQWMSRTIRDGQGHNSVTNRPQSEPASALTPGQATSRPVTDSPWSPAAALEAKADSTDVATKDHSIAPPTITPAELLNRKEPDQPLAGEAIPPQPLQEGSRQDRMEKQSAPRSPAEFVEEISDRVQRQLGQQESGPRAQTAQPNLSRQNSVPPGFHEETLVHKAEEIAEANREAVGSERAAQERRERAAEKVAEENREQAAVARETARTREAERVRMETLHRLEQATKQQAQQLAASQSTTVQRPRTEQPGHEQSSSAQEPETAGTVRIQPITAAAMGVLTAVAQGDVLLLPRQNHASSGQYPNQAAQTRTILRWLTPSVQDIATEASVTPMDRYLPRPSIREASTMIFAKPALAERTQDNTSQGAIPDIEFKQETVRGRRSRSDTVVSQTVSEQTELDDITQNQAGVNLGGEIDRIADKVYAVLERRLRSERMRKGML